MYRSFLGFPAPADFKFLPESSDSFACRGDFKFIFLAFCTGQSMCFFIKMKQIAVSILTKKSNEVVAFHKALLGFSLKEFNNITVSKSQNTTRNMTLYGTEGVIHVPS